MNDTEPELVEPASLQPSADLKARVLAATHAHKSTLRKRWVSQSLVLVVASWLIAAAVFVFAGGIRPTGRPASLMIGTAGGTASIAALAVWLLLTRGRSSLGRARTLLIPVIVGTVPAILSWRVFWSMQYPDGLEHWDTRPGFRCLSLTLSMAVCPLVVFVATRRSSDPQHPALTGLAAGVGVGAGATLFTDLWCPVAFVPHLLLGHALPVVLLGSVGMLLGSLFIRMR